MLASRNFQEAPQDLIARGRDAGDVAISTAFGPASLQLFKVWTGQTQSHSLRQAG